MRYTVIAAAAFVASVAALPQRGGAWSGRGGAWPKQGGDSPDDDGDCEVAWVTVDPESEATPSSDIVVDPVPTTASSVPVVVPVETSAAEPTTSKSRRPHRPTGRPTRRPTGRPTGRPTKPPGLPSSYTKPTAVPTTPKPTPTPEPTSAPPPSIPEQGAYPSPINSAAHTTSYSDAPEPTMEPQCTAASADYISGAIDGHNAKRAQHQAGELTWDEGLSCVAQRQAASCNFDHLMYVNGGGYGQNLAGGTSIGDSVEMWYGEADEYSSYYGQASPPFVAGHFTQVVWVGSTRLGCATHSCDGSTGSFTGDLTVCNYYEAGNMGGAYAENVLPASGSGSYDSSSGDW